MSAASSDRLSLPMSSAGELSTSGCPAREVWPSAFALDCLAGLSSEPKSLPCKWLYDDVGSQLFERITTLDAYYPSRVEEALLVKATAAISGRLTYPTTLVELGSGASRKTRLLLTATDALQSYVPIDISADELARACASLREQFPRLEIRPLCADFTTPRSLELSGVAQPVLLFFPGSTLGNMAPPQAVSFLSGLRETFGTGARLLLGVDLLKDEESLRAAYDDDAGVTAAFNLNLLTRMNRELGSTIDVGAFGHRAVWNAGEGRVEMHLEATAQQVIKLLGRSITIEAGETIHTENSYKLAAHHWQDLFAAAGWRIEQQWQSPQPSFLLALLAGGESSGNDEEGDDGHDDRTGAAAGKPSQVVRAR